VLNSLNHVLNPFKMQHMSEISKLIFFYLFSIYFFTMWLLANFAKEIENRFLKRLIQLEFSKISTYHILCPHVIQIDNLIKHHLLSNLLVTNFFFNIQGLFFWPTLPCFDPLRTPKLRQEGQKPHAQIFQRAPRLNFILANTKGLP
jgi:hypothetical protein